MTKDCPFDWEGFKTPGADGAEDTASEQCAVDWPGFEAHFMGDSRMIGVMGSMFIECADKQTDRLKNALLSGESLAVRLAAHTLKGSIGQVFAKPALKLIISIERRAIAGQVDELTEDVAKFMALVEAVKIEIGVYQELHAADE